VETSQVYSDHQEAPDFKNVGIIILYSLSCIFGAFCNVVSLLFFVIFNFVLILY